jgi:hypothetical protein
LALVEPREKNKYYPVSHIFKMQSPLPAQHQQPQQDPRPAQHVFTILPCGCRKYSRLCDEALTTRCAECTRPGYTTLTILEDFLTQTEVAVPTILADALANKSGLGYEFPCGCVQITDEDVRAQFSTCDKHKQLECASGKDRGQSLFYFSRWCPECVMKAVPSDASEGNFSPVLCSTHIVPPQNMACMFALIKTINKIFIYFSATKK